MDRTSLFLLGIFLLVSLVSIGYSALSSSLMVTGEANFRVREDVRITGIKVSSFENEGYETYSAEYYKDGTKVMVTLPKTDSKVTYEVEIKNTSENSYQLKEIKDEITSNPQMKYEIQGLNLEDIIGPSETKTFQIVVSYQDETSEVPSENAVTFETRYVFEVVQVTPPQTGNSFAEYLKSLANPDTITTYADKNGNKQEMYTFKHEKTDQTGELTDYRYIGDNPNNYVYFNCTDDNNVETCETWRIIGVFPIDDGTGKIEECIKLMRDSSLLRKNWDVNDDNNWTTASLNSYLNEEYYDTLSKTAQNMIINVMYYLGGADATDSTSYDETGSSFYAKERGITRYSMSYPVNWLGKIGLMYPSDYLYTYALEVDRTCYNSRLNCYNGSPNNGWIFKNYKNSGLIWLLTHDSSTYREAWYLTGNGYSRIGSLSGTYTDNYGSIIPALYLSSSVLRKEGKGSSDDPYQIDLSPIISFDYLGGTYNQFKTITLTAKDSNYSYMNVEVRNHNGKVVEKSRNNIIENTYTVTLEEEGTYTISVTAYDEDGNITKTEQRYVIRKPRNAVEKLKFQANSSSSYVNGDQKEMYTFRHYATEQTDALTDYRYIGKTPNNYIYFNCNGEIQNTSNCETWRIIGVFSVDDGTGNIEERIKIIRDTSLEDRVWNSSYSSDWTKADLNTYLNETYYGGLSNTAKAMIGETKYYLGGNEVYSGFGVTGPDYYEFERGNEVYSGNPKYWVEKIGLMYSSDYVYTYASGVNDACYWNGYYCESSRNGVPSSGWLFNSAYQWTLTPTTSSSHSSAVFSAGNVNSENVKNLHGVRPVLYLLPSVSIVDGDGSSGNPYQLTINKNN